MSSKKHLGTITILIKDRQAKAVNVQDILTKYGHIVMARMGVNVQPACIAHCTGLVSVAVQGTNQQLKVLNKELNSLYGIVAKLVILTD